MTVFGLPIKLFPQTWDNFTRAQELGRFPHGDPFYQFAPFRKFFMFFDPQNMQHPQEIFEAIAWVKRLRLEHCLLRVLHAKQLTIPQLHQRLENNEFLITRQSLYRYFNTNPESNRFPPRNFMQEFGSALDLSPEQVQLLDYLWQLCQLNRKNLRGSE